MKQNNDILLHKITKHSNMMIPFSEQVKSNKFPKQNMDLLGTTKVLKYRDRFVSTSEGDSIPSAGRPEDDTSFVKVGTTTYEDQIVQQKSFIILRADISFPYKYIAISTDYTRVISGIMNVETNTIADYIIPVAAYQLDDYIGLAVNDMYAGSIYYNPANVIAVDDSEPCYSILMEECSEEDSITKFKKDEKYIRFVFGDECMSVIQGYYDGNFNYHPINSVEEFYRYNPKRSINDVVNIRKELFKDLSIVVNDQEGDSNEENLDS